MKLTHYPALSQLDDEAPGLIVNGRTRWRRPDKNGMKSAASTSNCYATLLSQDWMACDTLWYFGEAHHDTRNPSN
jgi:hypothetical protein